MMGDRLCDRLCDASFAPKKEFPFRVNLFRGESGAQEKTRTSTSRRKLAPEEALRAAHLTML
jgi:hypothetical protein